MLFLDKIRKNKKQTNVSITRDKYLKNSKGQCQQFVLNFIAYILKRKKQLSGN